MRKLKITSLILAAIMVFSMLPLGMVSAFAAETEAEKNADLKIGTAAEWLAFVNNWYTNTVDYTGKTVVLTNDIDLSSVTTNPNPSDDGNKDGSGSFTGTFDGQGYTISGYNLPVAAHDYGIFGYSPAGTTTIKNVTFDGIVGSDYFTASKATGGEGRWRIGILYPRVTSGGTLNVENVCFEGVVFGRAVGAVASEVDSGATVNITSCTMNADVLNCWNGQAGGFIANNSGTVTITDSIMSGRVYYVNSTVKTEDPSDLGGFVGTSKGTLTIDSSIMNGSVLTNLANETETNTAYQYMGGFLGSSNNTTCVLTITDSIMIGTIDAKTDSNTKYQTAAGGFGGYIKGASVTVDDCAMYGAMVTQHDRNGHIFGWAATPASSLTVTNTILAGVVYEWNATKLIYSASGRICYSANASTTSNYNIYIGSSSYGASHALMGGSSYAFPRTESGNAVMRQRPYNFVSRTNLLDDKFDATINALAPDTKTYPELAEPFAAEKVKAIESYRADWTFSDTASPVPTACKELFDAVIADASVIDDANDLLQFAALLNGGYTFAGETIRLDTDVVLNEGWDAFAETVTAPATVWPVMINAQTFAGTFDGQGHTISGIYAMGTGEGFGIFGNVATGTVGTVKNAAIVNSYVSGNGQGVGGIFGEVDDEVTSAPITDPDYVNKTKAVVDNVYADIKVVNIATGNGNLGTGGIIGGSRTDVEITNTAFVGDVIGGIRGTAAFVGGVRPRQITYDGVAEVNLYLNTITIKNSYAAGLLQSTATKDSFVGALVGYSNANTTIHNVENVIINCVLDGLGDSRDGYLYGGAWCAANDKRLAGTTDYQIWNLTNVHYVITEGTDTTKAVGAAPGGSRYNGVVYAEAGLTATAAEELPKVLYAWNPAMSLTLTDDLAVNVYVDKDYTILNGTAVEADINGEAVTATEVDGEYKFTYTGILPQQMTDDVAVALGVISKTSTIKDYLVALLADEAAQDVAADLLRYGAAAQVVSGYKADALATAGLDLDGLGSTIGTITAETPVKGTAVTQIALRLENTLALVGNDGTVVSVYATEMDDVKTVGDATCSVAAYVKWAMDGGVTDAEDLALIKAIYAYGLSAKAYANA